jgi:hypothetical protein
MARRLTRRGGGRKGLDWLRPQVASRPSAKKSSSGSESSLEALLILQLADRKLPTPTQQALLIPGRKFRSDGAFLAERVAYDINGGTWNPRMRHSGGAGYEKDCEKHCLLVLHGWWPLVFTGKMVREGVAVDLLAMVLHARCAQKT